MAYIFKFFLPGLSLYSSGRKPPGSSPDNDQSSGCMGLNRILAWSQLELYFLGTLLLCFYLYGKQISHEKAGATAFFCKSYIRYDRCLLWLGSVPL